MQHHHKDRNALQRCCVFLHKRGPLHRITVENIVFALGMKAIFLVLGACGLANLWVAVFGDVGVMLLAVLNALRVLKRSGKAA